MNLLEILQVKKQLFGDHQVNKSTSPTALVGIKKVIDDNLASFDEICGELDKDNKYVKIN